MSEVLDYLLSRMGLTGEDRSMLRTKRGFTDATIDRARFVSGGVQVRRYVDDAADKFGADALVMLGLMRERSGSRASVWRRLLEPGIIIPYFTNGHCTMLRPHKYTPRGQAPQPYFPNIEIQPDVHTVLAEGEFKAWAAIQYGYQAIAVPGISSFAGDYFDELQARIESAGIRYVTVLFDNEDKSTPGLPRYKADPRKRYDTQYYSYRMASRLADAGQGLTSVNVAWIPDRYRDATGKADIDGMLAAGVTVEEFDKVVEQALAPDAFLGAQPEEAQRILTARVRRQSRHSQLLVGVNQYLLQSEEGAKVISNFVARYVCTFVSETGECSHELLLVNEDEDQQHVTLDSVQRTDWKRFRAAVATRGNFIWGGTNQALDQLWRLILPEKLRTVKLRSSIGWDSEAQHYLFTNCVVDRNGTVFEYDDDGIAEVNGSAYKLVVGRDAPVVNFANSGSTWGPDSLRNLGKQLIENFGDESVAMALAWTCAVALKPWLFEFNRTFPILFVFGRHGSGKTRLCQWITRIFFNSSDPGSSTLIGQNSAAFIRNRAAQVRYLPFWLDEYRNNESSARHLDILRGIYDHTTVGISGGMIGTNRTFQLESAAMISGEDEPDDPTGALAERMVVVRIPDKIPGIHFQEIEQLQYSFDGIFVHLLRNREQLVTRIRQQYDQLLEKHRGMRVSQRTAINYALMHAVAKVVLGVELALDQVEKVFETIREDQAEKDALTEMILTCLYTYRSDPFLRTVMEVGKSTTGTPALNFNLHACHQVYATERRKSGQHITSRPTLKKLARSTPWVAVPDRVVRLHGKVMRVYQVNLDTAPEAILHMAYSIADEVTQAQLKARYGGDQGSLSGV